MTRLLSLFLLAALAHGAQYQIKLNPGDSVLVEAVTVTAPVPEPVPGPTPTSNVSLGINLPGPDEWNTGARGKMFVDLRTTAREIATNRWRVLTSDDNDVYEGGVYKGKFGSKNAKIAGTYLLSWAGAARSQNDAVLRGQILDLLRDPEVLRALGRVRAPKPAAPPADSPVVDLPEVGP